MFLWCVITVAKKDKNLADFLDWNKNKTKHNNKTINVTLVLQAWDSGNFIGFSLNQSWFCTLN